MYSWKSRKALSMLLMTQCSVYATRMNFYPFNLLFLLCNDCPIVDSTQSVNVVLELIIFPLLSIFSFSIFKVHEICRKTVFDSRKLVFCLFFAKYLFMLFFQFHYNFLLSLSVCFSITRTRCLGVGWSLLLPFIKNRGWSCSCEIINTLVEC